MIQSCYLKNVHNVDDDVAGDDDGESITKITTTNQ